MSIVGTWLGIIVYNYKDILDIIFLIWMDLIEYLLEFVETGFESSYT